MPYLISLVVPIYNEASTIRDNLTTILHAAAGCEYEFELIAVDDGSSDSSAEEIEQATVVDPRIKLISFTRNFGKEAAILAGLTHAKGDAVIVLDSDLQHPPQLLPQMLQFWHQGIYVVEAVKMDRGDEAISIGLFARMFYSLFNRFAGLDLNGQSDFKLLDRIVVDAYLAFPEHCRFFRGLIGWAQYPSARIPFSVPASVGGRKSQWSKRELLRYAVNNITNFSSTPLRWVSYLGFATLTFGAIMGTISLIQKFQGSAISGFTTVNLLIIIIGGTILLGLGIIGHYIALIYDEIKGRPSYLIKPPKKTPPP